MLKRRVQTFSLAVLVGATVVACDPGPTGVGVSLDRTGTLTTRIKTCHAGALVYDVQLVDFPDGRRLRWEIKSSVGAPVRQFTLGAVPTSFTETHKFDGAPLAGQGQFVISTSEADGDYQSFDVASLRTGRWFIGGKFLDDSQFQARDVCSY